MQKYNKFFQTMLNYRFLMFEIRDFTHFKHKITDIKHFQALNHKFFMIIMPFLRKKHYFCRGLTTIIYHGRTHSTYICGIRNRHCYPLRRAESLPAEPAIAPQTADECHLYQHHP